MNEPTPSVVAVRTAWQGPHRRRPPALPGRAAAAVALVATAVSCSPPRAIEAALVLEDIVAGARPSGLKDATPAPARRALTYRVAGRRYAADLYRPGAAAKAAIVLVPGVTPDGRRDARLVAFANTLARARFTVLAPDIGSLRDLKVKSTDARAIADAVRHLGAEEGGAVAVAAISYAAGPAILAALEDDVRCRVRFILAIGGYFDSRAMLTFMTTGYYREAPGAPWRHDPRRSPYTRWIALKSHADLVADAADRAALSEIARRRLDRLDAAIGDLAAGLGPEGRAVLDFIFNDDPDRTARLIDALPAAVRGEIRALDLSRRDLGRLSARLILVHGRDDPVIPHRHSADLAAALPPGRAALYVPASLTHVALSPGGVADTLTLWRAIYRVLEERDGLGDASAPTRGCPDDPVEALG